MTATKERKTRTGGIRLSAPALKEALAAVASAVPGKSPRPILQSVLLSGGVLSGSDGEIRIDVEIDAPPGVTFLLPKDRLHAIVKEFSGREITITQNDTTCVITTEDNEWTFPTEDANEYPSWKVTGAKPVVHLPADQFVRAVTGTTFAADKESSRYALGAVLVEVKGDVVTFVATDGRRLASVQCDHDQAVDDSQTLVPKRVMEIIRDLASEDASLTVQLEATHREIVATVGNAKVTASLMEGRFPRWRDTIPEDSGAKPTTVEKAALLRSTLAAALCASEESKGVTFSISQDCILLESKSSERGRSKVKCGVIDPGKSTSVTLNPSFVKEWLNGIAGGKDADPNVEVEAVDAQSAVILRCGDNTGVIMPLAKD